MCSTFLYLSNDLNTDVTRYKYLILHYSLPFLEGQKLISKLT